MQENMSVKSLSVGALFVCFTIWQPFSVQRAEAQETSLKEFPLAIICESSGIPHVFYLSKVQKDGVAVYVRPDGVVGMISQTGTATVVGAEVERGTCGGKTLKELRSAGQTVEIEK